jgi:hypothetical protein
MHPDPAKERSVPKLVGADFELGNFILGLTRSGGSGPEAARALLGEIEGVDATRAGRIRWLRSSWSWGDPQDSGRKFLASNGGCAYIDLDHLELCIPEVRSAFDHAAASAALLLIARAAQRRANERLPEGRRIQVLVNNSDGQSNSYGSHLNFLVSRAVLADLLERRPHYLQFLATHQLSSLVYAGQGKVGAENGRPAVAYQLSQRADFLETLLGLQTTFRRPIVNSRDETLCGRSRALARLHVIFYDNTLCPGASVLWAPCRSCWRCSRPRRSMRRSRSTTPCPRRSPSAMTRCCARRCASSTGAGPPPSKCNSASWSGRSGTAMRTASRACRAPTRSSRSGPTR